MFDHKRAYRFHSSNLSNGNYFQDRLWGDAVFGEVYLEEFQNFQ